MSKKIETVTIVVTLFPKKVMGKSWTGTRQQYIDRVTRVAIANMKSALLVRSKIVVK